MLIFFMLALQISASDKLIVPFESTIDQLFTVLKKNNTENIETAIVTLNNNFFKIDNYSLIFNSTSPQASSPQSPRILLFGKDKKLRLGFNHRLGNDRNLEAIQWREDKQEWELREITFTKSGPQISKANPSLCLTCHLDTKIHPNFNNAVNSLDPTQKNPSKNYTEFFKKIDPKDKVFKRLEKPPTPLSH